MAKDSQEKLIKELSTKIIKNLGLSANIKIKESKDNIEVLVEGEKLGALIGYHGETLESLQLLLSLISSKEAKEGEWKRVIVDIGNWRQERMEVLKSMVEKAITEIKASGAGKVTLPALSASQRREIHVLVSESYPEYQTVSEGEEPYRRVSLSIK